MKNNTNNQSTTNNQESLITINSNFSTTKLHYKLLDEKYLDENGKLKENYKFKLRFPEFGIIDSKIPAKEGEKFDTYLFLPEGEGRKGEGGLRTKGYFKFSYMWNEGKWWIVDFDGNLIKPVPEEIKNSIHTYMNALSPKNQHTESYNSKSILQSTIQSNNLTSNIQHPTFNKLPLITVITVVFNGEKYLEQTIQSVINQTYPNVEYIIIDGGSTDGTLDIIKKYEDYIDYWISEKDKGIYDAMNKGITLAFGSWLGFLGSDDFFENNALTNYYISYCSNIECDIIYGNSRVLFGDKVLYYRKSDHQIDHIKKDFIFFHPDSIAKIKVYKELGMYDTNFKLAADYEFFLRAYFNGYKFLKIDKTIVNFRVGGFSSNYKKAFYEKIKIYKKYKSKLTFMFLIYSVYALIIPYIKDKLKIKEDSKLLRLYREAKYDM
ncbi:MAG: hypothetical protein KatS3mg002_1477 [Candidatus Woesearchaeota archaeon]|nr:MAG: hypothetical protein KatS3mg002_1477 [Candidatus Woesearchaeota archaeon]